MKKVELYTDGACSGNPGPGGYGAILRYREHERAISEGFRKTTNNRMELLAAIRGLELLKEPCMVDLYSDSKYLVDAISKGWLISWQKKGWKKADKKPVLNKDLWERIVALLDTHAVTLYWLKGHDGHPENERCDQMAVSAYQKSNLSIDEIYEKEEV